ncbi:MAG: Lrp/AsnC family transcriptional regulator [Pseudomonadota bacterium]
MMLDSIDLQILNTLQRNGDISNVELAERVALSPTPCARRVKLLEEAGFFLGKVTLLSQKDVGLPVTAFVHISMSRQKRDKLTRFEKTLSSWPEVMEFYLMTGDFDYLLRVVATGLDGFQQFIAKLTEIEGIGQMKSSLALKQVAYRTQLPLNQLTD